jgi:hypothetical protein
MPTAGEPSPGRVASSATAPLSAVCTRQKAAAKSERGMRRLVVVAVVVVVVVVVCQ